MRYHKSDISKYIGTCQSYLNDCLPDENVYIWQERRTRYRVLLVQLIGRYGSGYPGYKLRTGPTYPYLLSTKGKTGLEQGQTNNYNNENACLFFSFLVLGQSASAGTQPPLLEYCSALVCNFEGKENIYQPIICRENQQR